MQPQYFEQATGLNPDTFTFKLLEVNDDSAFYEVYNLDGSLAGTFYEDAYYCYGWKPHNTQEKK